MPGCLFLILLSIFENKGQEFIILNDARMSIEVEVWREGSIIHHHIMQPNESFEVNLKSGILLRWKYLTSICAHGNIKGAYPGIRKIGHRTYEVHILPNIIGSLTRRYGRICIQPCPQV